MSVEMPDWPEGLQVRGELDRIVVTASIMDGFEQKCPTYLAYKMRRGLWPEAGDRFEKRRKMLPFAFGRMRDVITATEDGSPIEFAVESLINEERKNEPPVHPMLAAYIRHGVETYVAASRERNTELDLRPSPERKITFQRPNAVDRELTAWGTWYETEDGLYREFRQLRMGKARPSDERSMRRAACAAKLLVDGADDVGRSKHVPDRVAVVEMGVLDGSVTVIWEGTFTEAREFYDEVFRPLPAAVLEQPLELRPGRDCKDCDWRKDCPAVPKIRGLLGLPSKAATSRHVSASDLAEYAGCPSRYLARTMYLPATGDHDESSVQRRGLNVHRWLETAHLRGHLCTSNDLPDPKPGGADPLGVLDELEYAEVHPYLSAHLEVCPFKEESDEFETEPRFYVWDADSDVLVVAGPDMRMRLKNVPVWRETKTLLYNPPSSPEEAVDRWVQVALDLVMLAEGVDSVERTRPDYAIGTLELECLTDRGAQLLYLHTDDEMLVARARKKVAESAYRWSQDMNFQPTPGAKCQNCRAVKWCTDAEPVEAAEQTDDDGYFVLDEESEY